MGTGARVVLDGADAAVRRLPGGPVLAAALRPGVGDDGSGASRAEGPTGTARQGLATGDTGTSSSSNIESRLSESADLNLYYLELQERISAESREYSALSNVLKARHDTVKNAIGNIR
jgi:hypothetical protein